MLFAACSSCFFFSFTESFHLLRANSIWRSGINRMLIIAKDEWESIAHPCLAPTRLRVYVLGKYFVAAFYVVFAAAVVSKNNPWKRFFMRMVINDMKNNAMGVNLHKTFFLASTCWLDQARLHNQNFPKRTQNFIRLWI